MQNAQEVFHKNNSRYYFLEVIYEMLCDIDFYDPYGLNELKGAFFSALVFQFDDKLVRAGPPVLCVELQEMLTDICVCCDILVDAFKQDNELGNCLKPLILSE